MMQNSIAKVHGATGVYLPAGRTQGTFRCDTCGHETAATQRTHSRDGRGERIIVCRRARCRPVARA